MGRVRQNEQDEPFEPRDVSRDRPQWAAYPGRLAKVVQGAEVDVHYGADVLNEAIALSMPGDVIHVYGVHGPLHLGSAVFQSLKRKADVRFVGKIDAVIDTVTFDGSYFDGDIAFYDITIRNRPNNFAPVWLKGYGACVDLLQFVRCRFQGSEDGGWAGYGQKWQIKGTGYAACGVRVYDCDLRQDGAEEHNIYLLNPMGRNVFDGLVLGNTRRTAIQGASRRYPNGQGGDDPLYLGDVPWEQQESFHVRDCHAADIRLSGGSAFTMAGFGGQFIVERSSLQDSSFGYVAVSSSTWHGTPLYGRSEALYATNKVSILSPDFDLPGVSRDHIMLSGVDVAVVDLYGAHMQGSKAAISLQTAHGGGLGVNTFGLRGGGRKPADHDSFLSATKMKYQESWLSDEEINQFASV